MDPPRGRGVQFPFAVTDRVIIKVSRAQAWYIILVQKILVSYNCDLTWFRGTRGHRSALLGVRLL